ncbi:hypothetical protein [Neisseria sp. Ec49-e6-T10]|uniref:hypothetical protein n=1 Tax=Neisseria sp. Ec49-e6-T10 TaxID=3140744 RepID=UPI003EBBE7B2
MEKVFEDYFSELQADMVALALEYVNKQAEKIYIYCACENNGLAFDVFYKLKDGFFRKHKLNGNLGNSSYDVSIDRQRALIKYGIEDLKSIYDLCIKDKRKMPTEMKLIYDVNNNSLEANYSYEIIYSNNKNLLPDHIFNQWFEEVSQQEA